MSADTLAIALRLAQLALEQGQTLDGRIAANGPTIGETIAEALAEHDAECGARNEIRRLAALRRQA